MRVGVPRELKPQETRVGLSPDTVRQVVAAGHEVFVEAGAGDFSGMTDAAYVEAGARVVRARAQAWAADLIVKVKEPIAAEWPLLRRGQVLFTYLHLAASVDVARAVIDSG